MKNFLSKKRYLLRKDCKGDGTLKVKNIPSKKSSVLFKFAFKIKLHKLLKSFVEDKLYPYIFIHILNDGKTKELKWHRYQYFHRENFIGPKFKLSKLDIYFKIQTKVIE